MIKAVLLDLDDTLIVTRTRTFLSRYLNALSEYARSLAADGTFLPRLIRSLERTIEAYDPSRSLFDRYMDDLAAEFGVPSTELIPFFAEFYEHTYPALCSSIQPRPAVSRVLDTLFGSGYRVVIATNPRLPEASIHHRMRAGGIDPARYPFEFITSMERMRFAKPAAEYYEEILLTLDLAADEVVMIGDDEENDIIGARAVGMRTLLVDGVEITGSDSSHSIIAFDELPDLLGKGLLDRLEVPRLTSATWLHRLAAFPGAVSQQIENSTDEMLEQHPAHGEWSVRDILCHLADYEIDQNENRIRRILDEENPFLSANYQPWAQGERYVDIPTHVAYARFVSLRNETLEWMGGFTDNEWGRAARSPIFGPTTLEEMVKFRTDHDRTHLRQIRNAIRCAHMSGQLADPEG